MFANARTAVISLLAGLTLAACSATQPATLPTTAPQSVAATEAPVATAAPTLAPSVAATTAPTVAAAAPTAAAPASAESVAAPDDPGAVAIERFLLAMHEGRYEDAAQLYGGDYMLLQMYNPTVAPEDHAALLKNACEVNGFRCLAPLSIAPSAQLPGAYDVTFRAEDGTVFGIQTPGDASNVHQSFGLLVEETPDGPLPITMPPFVS